MSDPANSTNSFTPSADLYKGISVLSSEDWIGLMTFFESAVTDNPTIQELMRAMLGIQNPGLSVHPVLGNVYKVLRTSGCKP